MIFRYLSTSGVLYVLSFVPRLVFKDIKHGWWKLIQLLWAGITKKAFIIEPRQADYRFKVITAGDVWVISETVIQREYDRDDISIPHSATIIDIGANIGGFAVPFGKKYPHSTIYAYEPFLGSFALLRENLALNGVKNVRAFPYAVGARSGPLTLDTTWSFACLYTTVPPKNPVKNDGIQVKGISLDDIFEKNGLARCDLLKLDCEGAEYDILFNATPSTLRNIAYILMEYHDNRTSYTHGDLIDFLEEYGFQITVEPNPGIDNTGYLLAANLHL